MELVSANTKNYLFITMNQYNDKDGLVRARVTMRRDQPFWEGGNSFIACESFRISSAPSRGGLYYKILPDTFYLGAVDRTTKPAKEVEWQEIKTTGADYIALKGKSISPVTQPQQRNITIRTAMCDHQQNSLAQSDPAYVLTKFGELWNDHGLEEGQPCRLTTDPGGNAVTYTGTITKSPLLSVEGPGGGPEGLFFPVTGNWGTVVDDTFQFIITDQVSMKIMNIGMPNSGPNVDFKKAICKLLGRSAFFEITKGPDANFGTIPVPLRKAGIQYMGPSSIEVDGIPDLWGPPPAPAPDGTVGDRQLNYKILWATDDLKIGSTVSVHVPPVGGANPVAGHYKHGTVTALDENWLALQTTDHPVYGCSINGGHFELTHDLKVWLADANNSWGVSGHPATPATGRDAVWNMLDEDFPWVLVSDSGHLPDVLEVALEIELDDPAAGGTAASQQQLNVMNAAMPVLKWERRVGVDRDLNRVERRACVRGESRYVYTPNELYWIFNNPQGGFDQAGEKLTETPYLLQTHENGGFKVVWDGTFSDFYISVEMHNALGLCGYFEYHAKKSQTGNAEWDIALQKPMEDMETWDHTYASTIAHLPASSVYVHPLAQPPVLIDPSAIAIGAKVCLIDGSEYILLSKQVIKDLEEVSETVKVYPTTILDKDGVPVYSWRGLPESVLGNTQQVSIESFGTFSGINIVIPNLPFQPMLGTASDDRILASLRLPFEYGTDNKTSGIVGETDFSYYGDLLFNSDSSRSYLRITTDQQLYDCDVEARLIRRDGGMEVLYLPFMGQFEIKLRFLQTQ